MVRSTTVCSLARMNSAFRPCPRGSSRSGPRTASPVSPCPAQGRCDVPPRTDTTRRSLVARLSSSSVPDHRLGYGQRLLEDAGHGLAVDYCVKGGETAQALRHATTHMLRRGTMLRIDWARAVPVGGSENIGDQACQRSLWSRSMRWFTHDAGCLIQHVRDTETCSSTRGRSRLQGDHGS